MLFSRSDRPYGLKRNVCFNLKMHQGAASLMKILSVLGRIILFLFVIAAAYNLFFSINEIYKVEWYSLYFENDLIGLFIGSFLGLQIMFLLRFTGVRYILLVSGGYGLAVMALKLHTPPGTAAVSALGRSGSWPSVEDIRILCSFCAILFVEGLLYTYAVKLINGIVVRPIKYFCVTSKK